MEKKEEVRFQMISSVFDDAGDGLFRAFGLLPPICLLKRRGNLRQYIAIDCCIWST